MFELRFVGGAAGGNEFVGKSYYTGGKVLQTPAGSDCSGDGSAAGSGPVDVVGTGAGGGGGAVRTGGTDSVAGTAAVT